MQGTAREAKTMFSYGPLRVKVLMFGDHKRLTNIRYVQTQDAV